MEQHTVSGFQAIMVLFISIAVYFAPTIVAKLNKHPNIKTIFLYNLLFTYGGWTWFAAFYYAASKKKPGVVGWIISAIITAVMITIAVPDMRHKYEHLRQHPTGSSVAQ